MSKVAFVGGLLIDGTGTLEAGKSADLLVIEGNPLENIRAIAVDNMKVIMKEGAFVRG